MSQADAKNWKTAAYAAVAGHYKLLEEKESWEERIAASRAECARLGVSFGWDDEPAVANTSRALVCPCGTIIPLDYDNERAPRTDGVLHCKACREKTRAAVEADAAEEALRAKIEKPGDAAPAPVPSPSMKPAVEDIPF